LREMTEQSDRAEQKKIDSPTKLDLANLSAATVSEAV
jgi:hypothetical protein